MKLLLQTRFYPSVGGVETLAAVVCREWIAMGHEVTVSTDVASSGKPPARIAGFPVYHQPTPLKLLKLYRKHDVVVMMNISLKVLWPLWLSRKPVVFVHQSGYGIAGSWLIRLKEQSKRLVLQKTRCNIFCSESIKQQIGATKGVVIPNCYDDSVFSRETPEDRPHMVVFVGRLVSEKGAKLLLDAFAQMDTAAANFVATIIGDGPERESLEQQAGKLHNIQVRFTGTLQPEQVAAELRKHQMLVVPSLWSEPFGIVALEGMACGCVPLVADGGGLPEAIGNAGVSFSRGDVEDLANKLKTLLENPKELTRFRMAAPEHLARHTARKMAVAYLDCVVKDALPSILQAGRRES